MGIPVRAYLLTAVLATSGALHADTGGTWSGMLGAALPSGGTKQWVKTSIGPALDIMETYSLGSHDAIRMRFGYWDLKSSSDAPQTLILAKTAAASYPASTTNEVFGFSYGAEYVRTLPADFFVLGGLGVTYLSATRTGTFTLPSGAVTTNFGANNFVPYLTAGLGFQITQSLAVEARWQTAAMKAQLRPVNISGATSQVQFDKLNVSTFTIGLNLTF